MKTFCLVPSGMGTTPLAMKLRMPALVPRVAGREVKVLLIS